MILSCGEALIDMLPRISTEGEACFAPHAGGAVFNTAIALGRLGAPSAFFAGISNDMLGEILAATLTASNVDISLCARSERPTTVAFVKLVNGQATYAFYDEATAGRMLSAEDLPDLPASIGTLFVGGISLVNDPAAATYEALQARECGTRVTMIDPNIRPGFIAGKEAPYRARIERMVARTDIVKLSDEDLHWLAGPGDLVTLARQVLEKGPKLVFVTEGAKGARAVTATQDRFRAATVVTIVDTVGAGDTFNAGALAALHQAGVLTKAGVATISDAVLDAALGLGTRAAAVTVSRAGANPPWAHELGVWRVRAVLQRVSEAAVRVDGAVVGQVGPGLMTLICAMAGDTEADAAKLAVKVARLRIFRDDQGKMKVTARLAPPCGPVLNVGWLS